MMAATARKFAESTSHMGAARSDRDELFDIIFHQSFGRKNIVLSSGKPSNFYFDMKPTMLDPRGANLIAKLILPEMLNVGGEYIGGLEMGAVPITGAVLTHSYDLGTPVHGFFVRKKKKEHGAQKLIEGLREGLTLKGKRVVVFDDVTTSGESAMIAIRACREEGAEIVQAISIVDRQEGATELFAQNNIPFKSLFSADEFLSR